MNRQLPTSPSLPQPPTVPGTLAMSSDFRAWLKRAVEQFSADLVRSLNTDLTKVHDQINNAVQGVGPNLASATTISPTHPLHHVTGTAAITTITPPPGFSGPIWLIADGTWTLATGGNIAAAVTAVDRLAVQLVYDPQTSLWYPVGV